jgi:hypothetical protein
MPKSAGKTLSRDAFLKRAVIREVPLDDNAVVCIRALPASLIVSGVDASGVFEPANLLVHSLCDGNGVLLFAGEEKAQAMTIDHLALKKILDAIIDLNGLRPAEAGEAAGPEKN